MRSALSLYAVLVTLTSSTQAGNVVYVDANATGSVHDGSSWCSAYVDLQQGLAVASLGTEIRIAQGVYRPAPAGGSRNAAFAIPKGVTLRGSYRGCGAAEPSGRDFVLFATVLSGDLAGDDGPNFANRSDNVYHVVTTHNVTAATVLDGLTIRGGYADGPSAGPSVESKDQGSGVNNYNGHPTLSNCTLVDNYATNHGACNDHGGATLINCEFRDNWSGNVAAGLYVHFEMDTTVIGCSFHDNTTAGRGGGVYLKGDSTPTFSGCLFSGNNALQGGGLYCDSNNSPTLTNCTFNNNKAGPGPGRGGGVYAQDSNLSLVGCSFEENEVTGDGDAGGGAIYIQNGNLQLDQCDFVSNRIAGSFNGPAGVYTSGSTATITQCLFYAHFGGYYGSAMRNTDGNITVEDCVFESNSGYWGAVYNKSSVADFSRCRFTNNGGKNGVISSTHRGEIHISDSAFWYNHTGYVGGAGLFLLSGTGTITNSLFGLNSSGGSGGVIHSHAAHLSVTNSVFSGNSAAASGGAIAILDGTASSNHQTTISNCTFFGNSADSGRAIAMLVANPNSKNALIAENCIFRDGGSEVWQDGGNAGSTTVTYSNIEGGWPGVGNIDVNPMFVDPSGNDAWPGSEDDNLRLLNGSPCVNMGDNGAVVSTTDADGLPRIMFEVVDMGAYELPQPLVDPTKRKNRYVSFAPNKPTTVTALRVALTDRVCSFSTVCVNTGVSILDGLACVTGADCAQGQCVPRKCLNAGDCKVCTGGAEPGRACTGHSECSGGLCDASTETCDEQSQPTILGWVGQPYQPGCQNDDGSPRADDCAAEWAARVVVDPVFRTWPETLVHLGDCEIVPAQSYEISATTDGVVFTSPLTVGTTPKPWGKYWADVVGSFNGVTWTPPNGLVNVNDVQAWVKFKQLAPRAPHATWLDLDGEAPNWTINATDLQFILAGFRSEAYPPPPFLNQGGPEGCP